MLKIRSTAIDGVNSFIPSRALLEPDCSLATSLGVPHGLSDCPLNGFGLRTLAFLIFFSVSGAIFCFMDFIMAYVTGLGLLWVKNIYFFIPIENADQRGHWCFNIH